MTYLYGLINKYSTSFVSRWLILIIDVFTVAASFIFAVLVWYRFSMIGFENVLFFKHLAVITLVYTFSFLVTKSFSGIIRHTGLSDAFIILKATSLSLFLMLLINLYLLFEGFHNFGRFSFSLLIIHYFIVIFLLIGTRVLVKVLYVHITKQYSKKRIPVLIYGAGDAGMLTKNALTKDPLYYYVIVAYIDDNPYKIGKSIEGIPVYKREKALTESFIKEKEIKQLIISMQGIHPDKKKKIVEAGLKLKLQVKVVPPINNWINGQLTSTQLRRVKIEELLERDPIELENKNISRELRNKIILVTGGAGSIGSEIVRQILNYYPKRLVVLDQAESPIYDLQFELKSSKKYKNLLDKVEFVIASVRDKFRMEEIFDIYKPEIVFHAAAYKHVPLMEENPYEAVMINVFGTKIVSDLAVKYKVEKFVMISTDKAVNPTNIMGATKRIAEIYIQSLSNSKTKFITTRFGNVLGSNGSVVPLFRKQIEKGGPVTVTHKEIVRYFMTIPEACNLVLEAGSIGKGGDILIFDMGEPVKIYDLARKMIQLYGLEPDVDIKIVETGLRPGEKLYEELLNDSENTLPTHHPKIKHARVVKFEREEVEILLNELSEIILERDIFKLVQKMKQIVPEFKSNNSVFEKLDKKIS